MSLPISDLATLSWMRSGFSAQQSRKWIELDVQIFGAKSFRKCNMTLEQQVAELIAQGLKWEQILAKKKEEARLQDSNFQKTGLVEVN